MLRVLIVDDEPLMRKGVFSKINWQAMQLAFAGDAADGEEALEQIEAVRPHIVLTDICMPGIDGLTLIERAKAIDPLIQFVVISGYDDFQYARKAMHFGVDHYLLKPVNTDELRQVLEKLKEHFLEKDGEQDYRSLLLRHYEANMTLQRERMLTWRIQEEAHELHHHPDLAQVEQLQASGCIVIVFRIQSFSFPHKGFHAEDEQLIWFGIQNIVTQLLSQSGNSSIVFRHAYHSDELIVIVPIRTSVKWMSYSHFAENALESLQQYLQLEAAVGISSSNASGTSLKNTYEQARMAVRGEVLHGTGKVYEYSSLHISDPKERVTTTIIAADQERLIASYLRSKDEERIYQWLEQQYEYLCNLPQAGYLEFEQLSLQMYALLRKCLSEYGDPSEIILNERQHFLTMLLSCRSWRAGVDALFQTARTVMMFIPDVKASTNEDVINDVIQYIDQHYYENITLTWVSDHYFIHPNYFCKLFKQRCGENFNNYLTKVRLNHAINLMSNPDLRLAQIAGIVGYDSQAYFSSVFRKIYGVSPKKYREDLTGSC